MKQTINTQYIQNIETLSAKYHKEYNELAYNYRRMYALEMEVGAGRTPDEIHESVLDRMINHYENQK